MTLSIQIICHDALATAISIRSYILLLAWSEFVYCIVHSILGGSTGSNQRSLVPLSKDTFHSLILRHEKFLLLCSRFNLNSMCPLISVTLEVGGHVTAVWFLGEYQERVPFQLISSAFKCWGPSFNPPNQLFFWLYRVVLIILYAYYCVQKILRLY